MFLTWLQTVKEIWAPILFCSKSIEVSYTSGQRAEEKILPELQQ